MQMLSGIGHGRLQVNDLDDLIGETSKAQYTMHETAGEETLGKPCSSISSCTGPWRKATKEAVSDIEDEPASSAYLGGSQSKHADGVLEIGGVAV